MDTLFHDWNSDNGIEYPLPIQRKSLGLDNDLVELLWQNGEVVLQTQTTRKQSQDTLKSDENSSSFTHQNDNLAASWIDCPIDNIDKEFCPNILPEIPPLEKGVAVDFASLLTPRPCFEPFEGERSKNNVVERQAFSGLERDRVPEYSAKTIGSSNRVVKEGCTRKIGPHCDSVETGTLKQVITSSGMGSDTICWNTGSQSIDTYGHKRKNRDVTESGCRSDATELEYSGGGNKSSSQKSRRSRVAEVHNLSERRRRDRINEKMKALQELIPHSNKSDKASMLDEAIEYMKSLQLQLQLLWMGSGMAPMMLPGIQPYMSRMGMRVGPIGPPMLPAMQNLMRLSRFPLVDPAMTMPHSANQNPLNHSAMLGSIGYHNQIPNMSFPEQYANYMGFLSMPNGSQPMNMFNYGANSAAPQLNQTVMPQTNCKQ